MSHGTKWEFVPLVVVMENTTVTYSMNEFILHINDCIYIYIQKITQGALYLVVWTLPNPKPVNVESRKIVLIPAVHP